MLLHALHGQDEVVLEGNRVVVEGEKNDLVLHCDGCGSSGPDHGTTSGCALGVCPPRRLLLDCLLKLLPYAIRPFRWPEE